MTTPVPLPGLPPPADLAAGRAVIRCRKCHRPLTGDARSSGIGDDCAHNLGIRIAPRPGRFPAAQDGIPGV
jgi:Family of unknown function (DUF6011)